MAAADKDPAPAVTRGIGILGLLESSERPLTLTEIAHGLGIAKSSTSNLCSTLEAGGLVERVPLGYRLGRRLAELGAAYAMQFNQVREFFEVCAAHPVLRGEVVQIVTMDGTDALYLGRHEGRRQGRIGTPIGSRLPLALSATGNALLMHLADEDVERIWHAAPPAALTASSTVDLEGLLAKIRSARERGWAIDPGESFEGITGVAVPLEGWTPSDPALAIGVALPSDAMGEGGTERIGRALQAAALALTNPLAIRAAPSGRDAGLSESAEPPLAP